jgi:uncharacterized repeat protein (TIGR03843 family)
MVAGPGDETCDGPETTVAASCVYKPIRGERPLYDFPDGTLACREVAAHTISEASGWEIVPPTVMRDGPFGEGMVQLWVEVDDSVDIGELLGSDDPALRRIAVLDAVLNNADRKAGHLLVLPDGRIQGIDNGLCFAVEPKLRTVLWRWRGEPLTDDERAVLGRLREGLDGELGDGFATAARLRTSSETVVRIDDPSAGVGPAAPPGSEPAGSALAALLRSGPSIRYGMEASNGPRPPRAQSARRLTRAELLRDPNPDHRPGRRRREPGGAAPEEPAAAAEWPSSARRRSGLAGLAAMVGEGTEQLAHRLGPKATGRPAVGLGNLPEFFIGIFALRPACSTSFGPRSSARSWPTRYWSLASHSSPAACATGRRSSAPIRPR